MPSKSLVKEGADSPHDFDYTAYGLLLILILISVFTYPVDWATGGKVSLQHVWYYGWITAISTGAGVLPFYFISEPNKFWMGISNGRLYLILCCS